MNVHGSEINFDLNDDELKEVETFLKSKDWTNNTVDCEITSCKQSNRISDIRCVKINDVMHHVCNTCHYNFKYIKSFDDEFNIQYLTPHQEPHQRECWCYRCMTFDECKNYFYKGDIEYVKKMNFILKYAEYNTSTNMWDLYENLSEDLINEEYILYLCTRCGDTLFPSHA